MSSCYGLLLVVIGIICDMRLGPNLPPRIEHSVFVLGMRSKCWLHKLQFGYWHRCEALNDACRLSDVGLKEEIDKGRPTLSQDLLGQPSKLTGGSGA